MLGGDTARFICAHEWASQGRSRLKSPRMPAPCGDVGAWGPLLRHTRQPQRSPSPDAVAGGLKCEAPTCRANATRHKPHSPPREGSQAACVPPQAGCCTPQTLPANEVSASAISTGSCLPSHFRTLAPQVTRFSPPHLSSVKLWQAKFKKYPYSCACGRWPTK